MNPDTHRLKDTPRNNSSDAFFTTDHATTLISRTAPQIEVDARGKDKPGTETSVLFSGFLNKHSTFQISVDNPLPHARKLPKDPKQPNVDPGLDMTIRGWTHLATYTCFFSQAARALSPTDPDQPRLQVKLFFGTGSEYYRLGLCDTVESAPDPTLLIVITGIEPSYKITFKNPANRSETEPLEANNRWAVGIKTANIEAAIAQRYGRIINYDITVCAGYSTGHMGVQECIKAGFFALDKLKRLIFYDCLYATVKPAVDKVKALVPGVQVIAYVVTGGGNSFTVEAKDATFDKLVLKGIPGWNYINLMGNSTYHAIASARIINEGRIARIIDPIPAAYEKTLTDLVAQLASRGQFVSDEAVLKRVKTSLPSIAVPINTFAADKTKRTAAQAFFAHIGTTRRCLQRAPILFG
jgi:hypothetical protein